MSDSRASGAALAPFSGYFKKSIDERVQLLAPKLPAGTDLEQLKAVLATGGLTPSQADHMVENCVGVLSLPLGVCPTVVINGQHYVVPMTVEEPSVIAAASGAAKLVAEIGGGFTVTHSDRNIMTGQIQLLDITDVTKAIASVTENSANILNKINTEICASMVARGGGALFIKCHHRPSSSVSRCADSGVVVYVSVDVCDSMGANIINTICEQIAPYIVETVHQPDARIGLRILTNLCVDRNVTSAFRMPLSSLGYKGVDGSEVASRIVEAYHFACDDEFRAVTNNKGVMNGIDSVALATGQDWRAIEAAAHAWAAIKYRDENVVCKTVERRYLPLCDYWIADDCLHGSIKLPMSVGTKGGVLQSHPLYKFALELLGMPDSKTLAGIIVSVGLAQNFAAIRALAIEGIQRGHMALHAKNIAIAANASGETINECASVMGKLNRVNKLVAEQYIEARQLYAAAHIRPSQSPSVAPSVLFVELPSIKYNDSNGVPQAARLMVLFESEPSVGQQIIDLTSTSANSESVQSVFGQHADSQWLASNIVSQSQPLTRYQAQYHLLLNILKSLHDTSLSTPLPPQSADHTLQSSIVRAVMARLDALSVSHSGAGLMTGAQAWQVIEKRGEAHSVTQVEDGVRTMLL